MFHSTLSGVQLHSVSTAYPLPVGTIAHRARLGRLIKKEISRQAVYYYFSKWSRDGSLEKVWHHSLDSIRNNLDLACLNLDGSHALAKKGREPVADQGRKKAKTSNILPLTEGQVHAMLGRFK